MNNTDKFVPIIGKNVIENLTQGMYDDARFVYREYVQNAADQIDIATKQGLYKSGEQPSIIIQIDKEKRKIEVIDDATGIKQSDVLPLLGNIAQSTKNKYEDKGFRGIGRLGGLGYCEKLTFETSFFGENVKSTMVWDAKRLKEIFNDGNIQIGAAELISMIIEYSYSQEKESEHYFKVTMENVNKASEILLDVQKVTEYLSMVAPVPFKNTFTFKNQIYEKAKEKGVPIDEYNVYVNTDKLYKGYKDAILSDNKGSEKDEIKEIVFFEEEYDKQPLFWGWCGITAEMQQIPEVNKERLIRLRKSNIQIGLEDRLNEFHKDPAEGNLYFVGEVYALNKELIPNGRRDFFIDNEECTQFSRKLKEVLKKLHSIYYDFSTKNAAIKDSQNLEKNKEIIKDTTLNEQDKRKVTAEIERLEKKVTKAQTAIPKILNKYKDTDTEIFNVLNDSIKESGFDFTPKQDNNAPAPKAVQPKTQIVQPTPQTVVVNQTISLQEEKILKKVYAILRSNLIKSTAEELIQKIEEEFNK
jgi:molecular chaperone HtpG